MARNLPRDNQREKVYRAERNMFVLGSTDFKNVREVQKFVNSVTASKFWRNNGGPKFVVAEVRRADAMRSQAWVYNSRVLISPVQMNKHVVLHELAHILTHHISRNVQSHGPEFVLVLRHLIALFKDDDARRLFDKMLEESGARWGMQSRHFANRFVAP